MPDCSYGAREPTIRALTERLGLHRHHGDRVTDRSSGRWAGESWPSPARWLPGGQDMSPFIVSISPV